MLKELNLEKIYWFYLFGCKARCNISGYKFVVVVCPTLFIYYVGLVDT